MEDKRKWKRTVGISISDLWTHADRLRLFHAIRREKRSHGKRLCRRREAKQKFPSTTQPVGPGSTQNQSQSHIILDFALSFF